MLDHKRPLLGSNPAQFLMLYSITFPKCPKNSNIVAVVVVAAAAAVVIVIIPSFRNMMIDIR